VKAAATCVICGYKPSKGEGLVLARGRQRAIHCSQGCLDETLAQRRMAAARQRRRAIAAGSVAALLLAGGWTLARHHAPRPRSISLSWADIKPPKVELPKPPFIGPVWPPTDEDWLPTFERVRWTYPLPGPARRAPTADARLFGGEPTRGPAPVCHEGVCGVVLGGELWGEHVYAALDGVVERVHPGAGEEHGGGTVRIAHLGGMVVTQYFHLAAIPRGVARGAHIQAGDVIGLLGDTGISGERSGQRPHLHFALSTRPSNEFPETYWDPRPLMAHWPLKTPPHGTVAGLAASMTDEDALKRHRIR
jgi:murein DD-endopeptidase MepM/ murein hydrolase activator NlpD